MKFQDLNLIEPIQKALTEKGYLIPSPIQEQAIPVLLKNKDVLGSAQTGTGKTAAFALPILQNLYKEKQSQTHPKRKISTLVLAPTRELALQIYDNFIEYSKYLDINTTVIFGGVKQSNQVKELNRGTDILVATPGRLLDLIQQKIVSLLDVDYLVLDEADRMLDMGFIKDVKRIVKMVKAKRQTMLFSATMPKEIINLANQLLQDPVRIQITPVEETLDVINQSVYFIPKKEKIKLLIHLLKNKELKSVLVFSRTKYGANYIVRDLNQAGIQVSAIHGNKSQSARQKALNAFKNKEIRVLVATDIAARGIDVDDLSHVVNYDLPEVPETYIHRIGRTGRAGRGGVAIAFCSPEQFDLLKAIEKHIDMKIPESKDDKLSLDPSKIVTTPKKNRKKTTNSKSVRTDNTSNRKSNNSSKKKSNNSSNKQTSNSNKNKSTSKDTNKKNYTYSKKKSHKNNSKSRGYSRPSNKQNNRKSR